MDSLAIATLQHGKPKFKLINSMPEQRELCLQADLALGPALNPRRLPCPIQHRLQRD